MDSIINYRKLDKTIKKKVSNTLYLTDVIRFYHSLRIFDKWRINTNYNYSPLIIKLDNRKSLNIQNIIYETYNRMSNLEKLMYNDTNGFLSSIQYFNKVLI
jgi:hypothetical protein